jgi:hypothetical protein
MVFLLAQLNPYLIFNRGPISALCSKNNPRDIKYMPACPVGPSENTGTSRQIVPGWLFFSHALILNKNPHLWMDTDILQTSYQRDTQAVRPAFGDINQLYH